MPTVPMTYHRADISGGGWLRKTNPSRFYPPRTCPRSPGLLAPATKITSREVRPLLTTFKPLGPQLGNAAVLLRLGAVIVLI